MPLIRSPQGCIHLKSNKSHCSSTAATSVSAHGKPWDGLREPLCYLTVIGLCMSFTSYVTANPGEVASGLAPLWQQAIVRLEVPVTRQENGFTRHFIEHCSATVVTPGPRPILLSAWHCFDGFSAIGPPAVAYMRANDKSELQLIKTGGSMLEDWALLTPLRAFTHSGWIPIATQGPHHDTQLVSAGYAKTSPVAGSREMASEQRQLALDPSCQVIQNANTPPAASSCVAKKGASGGPILGRTASGSYRIYGVISAGDETSVSYFYPSHLLLGTVRELGSSAR